MALQLPVELPNLSLADFPVLPFVFEDRIQKLLGKGSFGQTFYLNDGFAYKKLVVQNDEQRAEIVQECKILKLISQHHRRTPAGERLLQTSDFFRNATSTVFYIKTEYRAGGSLIQKVPLQEKECRTIAQQMIKLLDELDYLRLIHLDLHLENILLSRTFWTPMIIDFGRSFYQGREKQLECKVGLFFLEIGSPERVQNQRMLDARAPQAQLVRITEKADYWSFAHSLFRLLSGERLFFHETDGRWDRERIMTSITEGITGRKLEQNLLFPNVSHVCLDFFAQLFLPADERMGINEMSAHPWMTSSVLELNQPIALNKIVPVSSAFAAYYKVEERKPSSLVVFFFDLSFSNAFPLKGKQKIFRVHHEKQNVLLRRDVYNFLAKTQVCPNEFVAYETPHRGSNNKGEWITPNSIEIMNSKFVLVKRSHHV